LIAPDYDRDVRRELARPRGHIALEVHDNPDTLWMGIDRWLPGRVVRYRNITIRRWTRGGSGFAASLNVDP
jgi:hypothetical protein